MLGAGGGRREPGRRRCAGRGGRAPADGSSRRSGRGRAPMTSPRLRPPRGSPWPSARRARRDGRVPVPVPAARRAAHRELTSRIDSGPWWGIRATPRRQALLDTFAADLQAQARPGDAAARLLPGQRATTCTGRVTDRRQLVLARCRARRAAAAADDQLLSPSPHRADTGRAPHADGRQVGGRAHRLVRRTASTRRRWSARRMRSSASRRTRPRSTCWPGCRAG